MLKNMRSRNPSGAFCHIFPAHEILESPEVLPAVFIFQERKSTRAVFLKRKAITNVLTLRILLTLSGSYLIS